MSADGNQQQNDPFLHPIEEEFDEIKTLNDSNSNFNCKYEPE